MNVYIREYKKGEQQYGRRGHLRNSFEPVFNKLVFLAEVEIPENVMLRQGDTVEINDKKYIFDSIVDSKIVFKKNKSKVYYRKEEFPVRF